MTHEFVNLPLSEVTLRLTLSEPLPELVAYFSDLHRKLESDYDLRDIVQLSQAPGVPPGFKVGIIGAHGALYINRKTGVQFLVQGQLVSIGWTEDLGNYPRYPAMLSELDQLFSTACEVAGMGALPIVVNMSYENSIPVEDGGSQRDVAKRYFPGICCPVLEYADAVFESNLSIRVPNGIDYRATLHSNGVIGDSVLSLTCAAGKRINAGDSWKEALTDVHNALNKIFWEIISDEAKREWQ